ncbi:hypothetical protein [Paenibacillus albidus]|nr:hypothetical protein [Paenibacillus albidus]
MSLLEMCLKLLDGIVKLISIAVGLTQLRNSWKQTRKKKNHRK